MLHSVLEENPMTKIEPDKVADTLKALKKSKSPVIYLTERNGGFYAYCLPPKKRTLECLVAPNGDAKWELDKIGVMKTTLTAVAELEPDDFTWVGL